MLGEFQGMTNPVQMTKSRRSLTNSQPGSRSPSEDDEDDSADAKIPVDVNTPTRGRKGRKTDSEAMSTAS